MFAEAPSQSDCSTESAVLLLLHGRLLHSNPMAGTDNMLLALSGIGHFDGKAFGFASCDRKVGAAEGINVLRHRKVATTLDDGTWTT